MLIAGGFSLSKGLLEPGGENSPRKPKLTLYCRWFHHCCHPTRTSPEMPLGSAWWLWDLHLQCMWGHNPDQQQRGGLIHVCTVRAGTLSMWELSPSQLTQLSLKLLCTQGDHKIQSTIIIFHSFSSLKCPKYWEDWATNQQHGVLWHDDNCVSCVSISMAQGHVRPSKGTRLVLKDCPG